MIAIALLMYSCGTIKSNTDTTHKNHTPKVYHMSQSEKDDANYDLRESKKIIVTNLKHKQQNQQFAAHRTAEVQKQLNQLNATETKNKKTKHEHRQSFNFYH